MKKFGRYDVIDELGRGAMGIVYKAADPTIGRQVALKVLALESTHDEGTHSPQAMFMREVRAAGRLAHPSIVTIHDAFEDQETKTSCIVMELVPGKTLESILLSGQILTLDQTLKIIRQVAEGLEYAHQNQVVHRDLKPANILVTDDGRIKITDFGIAKVLAREGVARTIGVMGTPSYMSPEQVKGGEIDARTDLFSLGIIIFLMLTGQKPFMGDTASVMFKIVYEDPALPSGINSQLTPPYDYVVLKCLAKDRNKRYASARELLNDLDDLQQGRRPRSQAVTATVAVPAPKAPVAPPAANQTLVMTVPLIKESAPKKQAEQAAKPAAPPAAPPRQAPPPAPDAVQPTVAVRPPVPVAPPKKPPAQPAAPARQAPPPPPVSVQPTVAVKPPVPVAPPQVAPVEPVVPVEEEAPVAPRAKSNALPIASGAVLLILLGAAAFGYWKYHQVTATPVPPPQAVVLPPPSPPADLVPTEPVSPPPEPEKKPVVRKPKPVVVSKPVTPEPAPAPPQPAIAVLPPPNPGTPPPGADILAKPAVPKVSNVPRIVQIHCDYDLKDATYSIVGGGQTLFQSSFKGKKKGGFLGIKGAYEGTFSRTVTVPAGVTEVSFHVLGKDGAIDLTKSIPMPPPGGFVPTLQVEVGDDQVQLSWQGSSNPNP